MLFLIVFIKNHASHEESLHLYKNIEPRREFNSFGPIIAIGSLNFKIPFQAILKVIEVKSSIRKSKCPLYFQVYPLDSCEKRGSLIGQSSKAVVCQSNEIKK